MELSEYIDQIKFQLTGNILENELADDGFKKILEFSLRELNRYYDATALVEVQGKSCIDLTEVEEENNIKISSVSNVYRVDAVGSTSNAVTSSDPMFVAQWNLANNYYAYGTNNWALNYAAYNTTEQISNTFSTDLDFKEDKLGNKLYINFSGGIPSKVTIEYVPKFSNVNEVKGDYWVDILLRLALAHTKITLGRIRTRYTQSNALWTQDGETLLTEGNTELQALRERLQTQANFVYPVD